MISTVLTMASSLIFSVTSAQSIESFLHGQSHGMLPYAFPAETSFEELDRVLAHHFDVVGLVFCGPYIKGEVDWSVLDQAIERTEKAGSQALLHIMPRFGEGEGIGDTLSDGTHIAHTWNRNPNYSIIDVFDPAQVRKFNDYLEKAAQRYGKDSRIAGFEFYWGYQGETGFFTGDFNSEPARMGSVSAGYSDHALNEYNKWRKERTQAAVASLPMPSTGEQRREYIDFMHFRFDWLSIHFQAGAVRAMKQFTVKPIGVFAYLPSGKESYARNWCPTPGADFYRSAGSAASYDLPRTLSDSGIGWEDSALHAGRWDFTFAAMRRDELRMMAHGASFHAMFCRVYDTEPQWEKDIYNKVADFIKTDAPQLRSRIKREKSNVGLFLPTWSCAAWPGKSEEQPYIPMDGVHGFIRLHTGIIESFGLRYRLVTEEDLLRENGCSDLELIFIIAGNHLHKALGDKVFKRLKSDSRYAWVDFNGQMPTRSVIRSILEKRQMPVYLDYQGEDPIAGMVNNVLVNWSPEPVEVRYQESGKSVTQTLAGHEAVFVEKPGRLDDWK